MAELRHISCPVCGSPERKITGKTEHVSQKVKPLVSRCHDVQIVKCRHCSFYYTDPMTFWNRCDLDILYDSEYFPEPNDWWVAKRKKSARSTLSMLEKYVNCSERIFFLDVGCGDGHVIEEAIEYGWHAYGLDASNALASKARERLGRAATIHVETLEDNTFPSGFFDVICMNAVLEHLSNVQAAVQACHRLLKKRGIVYVLVPNEDRLAYATRSFLLRIKHSQKQTPKLSPLSPPYHIVGFNKKSLRYLFTKNGFSTRYLRIYRGDEHWEKTRAAEEMNLKGKIWRRLETLCWSLGGLLGRGVVIGAIMQKTQASFELDEMAITCPPGS